MPDITDLTEVDKAHLLGYMRHADPDLYAEALADLEAFHARVAARRDPMCGQVPA